MVRVDRRGMVLGGGALALAACAPRVRVGESNKDGGLKKPKGGIGGTGVVGTLTDFGSLLVNGLVIETSARTQVSDAFGPSVLAGLAIGQSLTIEAETTQLFGSETTDAVYEAIRVHITHPVVGRVTEVDTRGERALVAGVPVTLEPGALGRFVPGSRMAVSGLWRGISVVASRVEPVDAAGKDVIAGEVGGIGGTGQPLIGGRAVTAPVESLPAPGTFVTAIGRDAPEGFRVEKLTPGRFFGAAGALTDLSVEGYLEPIAAAPRFALSGLGHSFDEAAALASLSDARAVFSGAYDGSFVVEDGLVLPQNLPDRRRLLANVTNGTTKGELRSTRSSN